METHENEPLGPQEHNMEIHRMDIKTGQDQVREDEPARNSCISSQRMSQFSDLALRAPQITRSKCAMVGRGACSCEGPGPARGEGLPWNWRRFNLPPQGRDRWGRLEDGWWVRHHVKARKRPFHPIHRKTPFDSGMIQSRRALVPWRANDP